MRFAIFDHAGKGSYLHQQLVAHGHTHVTNIEAGDLILLDCDWPWAHPRPAILDAAEGAGAHVVLYPHGGMPTVFVYDGLCVPDARVKARLEHGIGSIAIAREFGAEERLKQHAAGWLFSPTAPFTPLDGPGRVLFAPMHPNIEALQNRTNGHDPAPPVNQRIYRELLDLGVDLTVSLVGPPNRNGVWQHPRAKLVVNDQMSFQASYQLVSEADTVVAAGTLGALAVALGKPTVMFCQGDFSDYIGGEYRAAEHRDAYAAAARYPLDAEDGDLDGLLTRACQGDEAAAEWREAFIGTDDGTTAAIRLLEQLASAPLPEQANYVDGDQGGTMKREDPEPTPDEPQPDEGDGGEETKHVAVGGVTARSGAVI